MRQYTKNNSISSELKVFVWQPHSDPHCTICTQFSQRGRPKKTRPATQHMDTLEQLNVSTSQTWSDPEPLNLSRFLQPAQSLSLCDLQCKKCMCVADCPVQTSCGKLLCYTCIVAHLHMSDIPYPCCGELHEPSTLSPAGDVAVKIIGSLLLHCSRCTSTVELRKMREHITSNCTVLIPPSPSRLTVRQIMSQPADAPPTGVEKKLASSVVKRILNTSPHQPSSADVVTSYSWAG